MRATKNQFLLLLLAVSVFAATAWTTGCKNKDEATDTSGITDEGDETGDEAATDDDTPDDPGDGAGDEDGGDIGGGGDDTAANPGDDDMVESMEFAQGERAITITKDELMKRYWEDKRWRGSSTAQVSGRSSKLMTLNLASAANFGYDSETTADFTVVSNDGEKVIFEIEFHAVVSTLVFDDVEVQLRPPTPEQKALLEIADYAIKGALLASNPGLLAKYLLFIKGLKIAGDLIDTADPGLKNTLTWLLGNRFDVDGTVKEYKAEFDKLSLKRFQVEFSRSDGIKKITQLDKTKGKVFTPREMLRVVNNVSIFDDYFIYPTEIEVGDSYDVDASDIAGILILDRDADVTGKISLKYEKDEPSDEPSETVALINVTEGNLTYRTSNSEDEENVNVTTPGGYFRVNKENYLVTFARIELDASRIVSSNDHLLFGSEDALDVKANTYYKAWMLVKDEAE